MAPVDPITPLRHVVALHELTIDEGGDLGTLLREASIALQGVTGCVKTYVMQFAEADGFAHVHFHVVPRMADHPDDRKGPAVFAYLKEAPVSEQRRDELAAALQAAWPASRSQ